MGSNSCVCVGVVLHVLVVWGKAGMIPTPVLYEYVTRAIAKKAEVEDSVLPRFLGCLFFPVFEVRTARRGRQAAVKSRPPTRARLAQHRRASSIACFVPLNAHPSPSLPLPSPTAPRAAFGAGADGNPREHVRVHEAKNSRWSAEGERVFGLATAARSSRVT